MSTSNCWQTTLAANVEQHNGWPVFYEWIEVTNLGGSPVWLATDGTPATVSGAGLDVVPANSTVMVANRQPKLVDFLEEAGSTAQHLADPPSGSLTYVSLIGSGTPQVVVSPQ
jgi:hypothetical protein